MPKVRLQLNTGQNTTDFLSQSDMSCVNMYPTISTSPGSATRVSVRETHGIDFEAFSGTTPADGSVFQGAITLAGGTLYAIYAGELYSINPVFGTATKLATLSGASTTFLFNLAYNGSLIAMVEDSATNTVVHFWDVGASSYSNATFPSSFKGTDVTYSNGHFVYIGDGVVFHGLSNTDASKGAGFSALDFTLTDSFTAGAIQEHDGQVYAFFLDKIYIYQYAGLSQFAFRKYPTDIDVGLFHTCSVISTDVGLFFLGFRHGGVLEPMVLSGQSVKSITTEGFNFELDSLSPSDIATFSSLIVSSWSYSIDDNFFVGFNIFTTFDQKQGFSLVYDAKESAKSGFPIWHKRTTSAKTGRLPFANYYTTSTTSGLIALGDLDDGVNWYYGIGTVTGANGDELGFVTDKEVQFNYINTDYERVRFSALELYGDNLLSTIEMSFAEIDGSGAMNESTARTSGSSNKNFMEWRRLGQSKLPRRFKLKMDQGTANTGRMQFTDVMVRIPDGG